MKENFLVDLSKQFAVDIVNLCTDVKENRKSNAEKRSKVVPAGKNLLRERKYLDSWGNVANTTSQMGTS